MNSKQIIVAVVVALLVSVAVSVFAPAARTIFTNNPAVGGGGVVRNVVDTFTLGIAIGNSGRFEQRVTIGPGRNQGVWTNRTGKTIYVDTSDFGLSGGVASSSLVLYATTTVSATSITNDFVRPAVPAVYLPIDGYSMATGTVGNSAAAFAKSTTTALGLGLTPIYNGGSIIFQLQSKNGNLCNGGGCETATSTNRGWTNAVAHFSGHFAP